MRAAADPPIFGGCRAFFLRRPARLGGVAKREGLLWDGERIDVEMMAMLEADWRGVV
jgi:hypothetical protein